MSVISNNQLAGAAGQGGAADFKIDRSLRFNDGDSPSLSRNFSSAGNRKKWTWSGWFKIGSESQPGRLFSAGADATNRTNIFYYPRSNSLGIGFYSHVGGSVVGQAGTTAVLADHSAWYHLVFAFDAANSTTADRLKIYINGVEQAISYTVNVSDIDHLVSNNIAHYVGRGADGYSFDGYLATFTSSTVKHLVRLTSVNTTTTMFGSQRDSLVITTAPFQSIKAIGKAIPLAPLMQVLCLSIKVLTEMIRLDLLLKPGLHSCLRHQPRSQVLQKLESARCEIQVNQMTTISSLMVRISAVTGLQGEESQRLNLP